MGARGAPAKFSGFGGHWRRRVAVEIGRGRVKCLGRSADPGYKGERRSSAETAPYELR